MTSKPSRETAFLVLEALVLSGILLALFSLHDARFAYNDSLVNRERCQRLANRIASLREMQSVADEQDSSEELGNALLVRLAVRCGMSENQLVAIQRLPPAEIPNTDYERQDTVVEIRQATMEQLVRLTLELEAHDGSAKATRVSLSHGRGASRKNTTVETTRETWNAELILTQLVFTARRARG